MLSSRQNRQIITYTVIMVFFIVVSFIGGFLLSQYLSKGQDFPILKQAYQILSNNAYKPLPQTVQMEYGMINGMLQVYDDPYTLFLEPVQNELQSDQLAGKFGGIGVRLEKDTAGNVIIYPIPQSPAQTAGIQEGDYLLAADGLQITKETRMEDIQAAIRGPVGQKVTIVVLEAPQHVTQKSYEIEREEVPLPSVTWNLAPGYGQVGVIQVNLIAATTPDEVTNAINNLKGKGVQYYILDLRNNGGGLLEAGFETASLFLAKGAVLEQQFRDQPVKSLQNEIDGPYTDIPLAVMVNNNTASSAEIVAGSLQEQDRAILVGSPTHGKYSIQLVFDLDDGSSLHVTAAHWWIPGLETSISGQSLQPDITVPEEQSNQPETLDLAIRELLKGNQ
jgi:carboxyl-terminal processing protease